MIKRLLTSAIGLVIFFLILPAPNAVFSAAVLIITLCTVFEIHNAVTKSKVMIGIGLLVSALIFYGTITSRLLVCIICGFVVYLLLSVIMFGKEKVSNIYMLGFATVVFSCFLSTLSALKSNFSSYAAFLPFMFAWTTDSGAYFAGKFLGKHKLIPHLSPKKTVEGAVGGIFACVVISLIYVWIMNTFFSVTVTKGNQYLNMAVISLIASVISQLGDFVSSAIKRDYNIKDYGNILPGHGGVLDRFDSIIFVSPMVLYILNII